MFTSWLSWFLHGRERVTIGTDICGAVFVFSKSAFSVFHVQLQTLPHPEIAKGYSAGMQCLNTAEGLFQPDHS